MLDTHQRDTSDAPPHRDARSWPWWEIAVFLLVAVALLIQSWPLINVVHYEVGDFAANSLLIQKAKSLDLFVGNYSRVGFNHPGPAILYVEAWGELVFHDWLHLVKSPFSGQQIGVIFYNAFWIALLCNAFRKITEGPKLALLLTAVFVFVSSCDDLRFFTGLWFPNLYYFPFAVMVVAVARLVDGRRDLLLSLALSSGFLINGHVSFVAMLGIIFVLALVSNFIVFRHDSTGRLIVSKAFFTANPRMLIAAVVLLFLFLVPLVIETFIRFPGPVAEYASFGSHHQPNTIGQALTFTGVYWGSRTNMWIGLVVLVAIAVAGYRKRGDLRLESVRAVAITLLAVTGAVLFYAKFGVDMLDQVYIALFYYSVPALALCAVPMLFDARYFSFSTNNFWLVCAVAFAAGTLYNTRQEPDYAGLYTHPNVVDVYKSLAALKGDGRLVLDLDPVNDWGETWSTILGAQIYAKRKGVDLFCVNGNWHISFTRDAMCSKNEVEHNRRLWVSKYVADRQVPGTLRFTQAGLGFYELSAPKFSLGGTFDVATNPMVFSAYLLKSGWSSVESQWVWEDKPEAHMSLDLAAGFSGTVVLDLSAYLPKADSTQTAQIFVDGKLAGEAHFSSALNRQAVAVSLHDTKNRLVDLKIVDNTLLSPKSSGVSNDDRTLGVGLYGLKIEPK